MQKDVSTSETIKSDTFLPRISRQGRNYATLIGWLLYRAFRGRTWKLAIATGLSLLHLASQAAAIYVVYWYGKEMEKTGLVTIPFLDASVDLKAQPEWLWVIVAVSTTGFVLSAVLLYLSRKQIFDIVEQHYARSLEQLILLTLRVPDPRAPVATQLFKDRRLGGLTTGCRRGALTSISFANAITGILGGFGGAIFLFRIDLPLTLLIVVSAVLAALFLYPLTLRAAKNAKNREKAQGALKVDVRRLTEDPTVEQTVTGLESADELSRVYLLRRRVLTELVFAIEIGITIIIGLVIYYMATEALAGREQWAIFIAYIGALRMTLQGASQAIRAFANVSRYYPQIVRYYLFLKDFQKLELDASCRGSSRRSGYPWHACKWGGRRRQNWRLPGDPCRRSDPRSRFRPSRRQIGAFGRPRCFCCNRPRQHTQQRRRPRPDTGPKDPKERGEIS